MPQLGTLTVHVSNPCSNPLPQPPAGTEANEAAIKFSRKWARVQAGVDPYDAAAVAPYELVSFTSCFHGRTMGALTLTYKVCPPTCWQCLR